MNLIKDRREELEAENKRLQDRILKNNIELEELDVTENVLLRLSGQKKAKPKPAPKAKRSAPARREKPKNLPTVRELVFEALMDARQRGLDGMTPKAIREYVISQYGYNMGPSANTVPSRMWRDTKEITKNTETGKFSLPEKIEAKDNAVDSNSPFASLFTTAAKSREAGPGGGP